MKFSISIRFVNHMNSTKFLGIVLLMVNAMMMPLPETLLTTIYLHLFIDG